MKLNKKLGRGDKRGHWREQVERWRASGLSKAAFCRQASLNVASFHYWCRALARAPRENTQGAASFVPVQIADALGGLRVQVGDVTLSCSEGVSAEQLCRWINAVRNAQCTF